MQEALGLTHAQLIDLAVLAGNDKSEHLTCKDDLLRLCDVCSTDIDLIANWLVMKAPECGGNIRELPIVKKFLDEHQELKEVWDISVNMYNHGDFEDYRPVPVVEEDEEEKEEGENRNLNSEETFNSEAEEADGEGEEVEIDDADWMEGLELPQEDLSIGDVLRIGYDDPRDMTIWKNHYALRLFHHCRQGRSVEERVLLERIYYWEQAPPTIVQMTEPIRRVVYGLIGLPQVVERRLLHGGSKSEPGVYRNVVIKVPRVEEILGLETPTVLWYVQHTALWNDNERLARKRKKKRTEWFYDLLEGSYRFGKKEGGFEGQPIPQLPGIPQDLIVSTLALRCLMLSSLEVGRRVSEKMFKAIVGRCTKSCTFQASAASRY